MKVPNSSGDNVRRIDADRDRGQPEPPPGGGPELLIVCRECGHRNEEGDGFCGSCGTFLEWAGEAVEGESEEPGPERKERRGLLGRMRSALGGGRRTKAEAPEPAPPPPVEALPAGRVEPAEPPEVSPSEPPEAESEPAEEEAEEAASVADAPPEPAPAPVEALPASPDQPEAPPEPLISEPPISEPPEAKPEPAEGEAAPPEREEAEVEAEVEAEAIEPPESPPAEPELAEPPGAEAPPEEVLPEEESPEEPEEAPPWESAETPPEEAPPEEVLPEEAPPEEDPRAGLAEAPTPTPAPDEEPSGAAGAEAPSKVDPPKVEPKQVDPQEQELGSGPARPAATELTPQEARLLAEQAKARAKAAAAERAAALVAKPRAPARREKRRRSGRAAKPAPPEPKSRPVTEVRKPPRREIAPGDLICGECGEGNDPERKFCRRCGASLAEAQVAGARRRIFRRKPREAGPETGRGGGPRGVAGKGRIGHRRAPSALQRAGTLVVLLGVAAAVIVAVGPFRDTVVDAFDRVRSAVFPRLEPVSPAGAEASSSMDGHPAAGAIDGAESTYWAGEDIANQSLEILLREPADIARFLITPGAGEEDFLAQPRPKEILVFFLPEAGSPPEPLRITLQDEPQAQTFDVDAAGTASVRIEIASVYPSEAGGLNVAIAEVELRTRT